MTSHGWRKTLAASSLVVAFVAATVLAQEKSSVAQDVEQKYPLLARLSIPEKELPAGCKIPINPKFPIEGVVNRKITTDPAAMQLVKEELTKRFQKRLKAVYYAVYEENNEIGVMGWAFDSAESAQEAQKALVALVGDRFRWWQRDEYVIGLWRDQGTSDACWNHFASAIENILAENPKKP